MPPRRYLGERAVIRASGSHAGSLLKAIGGLLASQGGCPFDAASAAAHVSSAGVGLALSVLVTRQEPPPPRDGVSARASCSRRP